MTLMTRWWQPGVNSRAMPVEEARKPAKEQGAGASSMLHKNQAR